MLKFRIIARMDIRNEYLIKTVKCEGVRKVGNPGEFIRTYDRNMIDEVLLYDTVASLYERNTLRDIIEAASEFAFCPITVGGGIRSIEDVRVLLSSGADKVAINTAAIHDPSLINALSHKYGSSTISLQLDAKLRCRDRNISAESLAADGNMKLDCKKPDRNSWYEAMTNGARQATGRDALEWAEEAVERGVGEIIVTAIDREGTGRGIDVELIRGLSHLPVPIVASGGYGAPADAVAAHKAGASGVAIAGNLHYGREMIANIKQQLAASGVPVRHGN